MRAGRELDLIIAKEVMGHGISREKRGTWIEGTPRGTRPLAPYSSDIQAAWEVAEKVGISLIPISEDGVRKGWFALAGAAGSGRGWKSPADFIQYLQTADFASAGAAVGEDAPLTICIAAAKQVEKSRAEKTDQSSEDNAQSQVH